MRSKSFNVAVIAATALCLALLAQIIHAGNAFAQPTPPERRWNDRSISSSSDAYASGADSRASSASDIMANPSTDPPSTLDEVPGESKGVHATWLERALRAVADPSQSEGNDVYLLVLAVAFYLACLLAAEHFNVGEDLDGDGTRGHGDALIMLEETRNGQGRKPPRCVDCSEAHGQSKPIARS
jgi:hypothetical protein